MAKIRKKDRSRNNRNDSRVKYFSGAVFLFFIVIFLRLFQIQVVNHEFYSVLAQDQHSLYEKINAERGNIYIKDNSSEGLYPVAINKDFDLVYVVPCNIEDENRHELSKKVSSILSVDYEDVFFKVNKANDPYEVIKRKVSDEESSILESEDLEGVATLPESFRYYPAGSLASSVIGFLGYSGDKKKGQYGIEGYCDKELEGQMGYIEIEKDVYGNWISFGNKNFQSSKAGDDVVLTLDYTVQHLVERKLEEAVENYEAEKGEIIIMNPNTGEIVAMAQYPNYDPNKYFEVEDMETFLNHSVHDLYEPGSIQKTITMAIGIDTGKIAPSTTYVDEGSLLIDGWTIRNSDYKAHGVQTMTEALEKSLNTGSIFVQKQVDRSVFYEYLRDFGLDKKTGIELSGEAKGNLSNLDVRNDINYATASFGQGISVTPLGILTAITALANDGKLMKPYIIDSFIDSEGNVRSNKPEVVRQVISPRSANLVSAMMVSVVKNGHAKKAGVEGYKIAGKTGTAQIPDENGGYDEERTVHTFVGFGPMPNPRFSILVKLDAPNARFAESTSVPVFGEIAEELVKYYNIAPTEF